MGWIWSIGKRLTSCLHSCIDEWKLVAGLERGRRTVKTGKRRKASSLPFKVQTSSETKSLSSSLFYSISSPCLDDLSKPSVSLRILEAVHCYPSKPVITK